MTPSENKYLIFTFILNVTSTSPGKRSKLKVCNILVIINFIHINNKFYYLKRNKPHFHDEVALVRF